MDVCVCEYRLTIIYGRWGEIPLAVQKMSIIRMSPSLFDERPYDHTTKTDIWCHLDHLELWI